MNVQEIINKWYELASGGNVERAEPFFQFVAVWVAFNALYTSRHSDEIGDWDQICSFSREPKAIDIHRDLLRCDEEYQRAIATLKERGVYDVRSHIRRHIPNERDLTRVLSCLYQIRCNLFHGGKMPDNQRDERLVVAGHQIISKLIKSYLEGNI